MNTNRLSKALFSALNTQMTREGNAAQIYLALGVWADDQGYGGIANFLYRHSNEERNHMIKFMEYIQERGAKPKIEALAAPPADPKSLTDCFDRVYKHEIDNTNGIYAIAELSMKEKDWATWNFMQWFVREQREEEKLATDLIDQLKIAGGDRATDESLFELDKSLRKAPDDAKLATEATAARP
ncbi:ferritin [Niabella soli]|uniref:Ferritin n=1 Tax=Niabella soli DSM 19437 TaxID=929713 RepID=W0F1S1_9BACT|nr:ferritin [Niabella soli]AHF15271.1 dolichol kinase [Niabella soli DSM 19437]